MTGEIEGLQDNLSAVAGANLSREFFDHCEKIYCLSIKFMKSLMKELWTILIRCAHTTQIHFCQLFSVTILQFFRRTPCQAFCRDMEAKHEISVRGKIIKVF